jgi:hypothetical protein
MAKRTRILAPLRGLKSIADSHVFGPDGTRLASTAEEFTVRN